MGWQKVVTYTPYEYKQEMKKRGIIVAIGFIAFFLLIVGLVYLVSLQISGSAWGQSGFTIGNGNTLYTPVDIYGSVCNSSGLYIQMKAGLYITINKVEAKPIAGFSSKNVLNSSTPNSLFIYYFPLICSKAGQHYSVNLNVYSIYSPIDGSPSNKIITGNIYGLIDACKFLQGNINCS